MSENEKTTPTKEAVTLSNGEIVEFNPKEKMKLSVQVNNDFSTEVFAAFRSGHVITKHLGSVLAARAIAHGFTQKVRDCIAGDKTVEDAIASVEDVLESMGKDQWNQGREPGTSGPKGNTLELIQAIAKVRKAPIEAVTAWLQDRTPGEKTKLRNVPEIALEIAKMRAQAAKKSGEPEVNAFEGLTA